MAFTLKIIILVAFVQAVSGLAGDNAKAFTCASITMPEMTGAMREQILEYHNRRRANLASGNVAAKGRTLPGAQNMYKLSWDCLLERKAQNFLKLGNEITQRTLDALQPYTLNKYSQYLCAMKPTTYDNFVLPGLEGWWNQVKQQTGVAYMNTTLSAFANMAYDLATRVGCSVRKHGNNSHMICIYDQGPEFVGAFIYSSGPKCQCTAYKNSVCSVLDSLCIKN